MAIQAMIKDLCACSGPSGFEEAVAERAAEILKPFMDTVTTDTLGNVIGARKCGREGAPQLLLDAHIDEVGLIVTGVREGFLQFAPIGGLHGWTLPASEVELMTTPPIRGYIACMPPHTTEAGDFEKAIPTDALYIDIGMNQEEAEQAVPVGTPGVLTSAVKALAGGVLSGKAMDDRACFAIVADALERIRNQALSVDLYVMASVQEEVGLRGAVTGAYGIRPDYAFVLDVTHAHTPGAKEEKTTRFHGGPAVGVGTDMNRALTDFVRQTAEAEGIPYQLEALPGRSGTNAHVIQLVHTGVATALISLPLKYMHSPVECLSLADAENTAALLAACIVNFGREGMEGA